MIDWDGNGYWVGEFAPELPAFFKWVIGLSLEESRDHLLNYLEKTPSLKKDEREKLIITTNLKKRSGKRK